MKLPLPVVPYDHDSGSVVTQETVDASTHHVFVKIPNMVSGGTGIFDFFIVSVWRRRSPSRSPPRHAFLNEVVANALAHRVKLISVETRRSALRHEVNVEKSSELPSDFLHDANVTEPEGFIEV